VDFVFNADVEPTVNILDFPIVPKEAVPEEKLLQFPLKGSKQSNYREHPWGSGRFYYVREVERDPVLKLCFTGTCSPDSKGLVEELNMVVVNPLHLSGTLKIPSSGPICVPALPAAMIRDLEPKSYTCKEIQIPKIDEIIFNNARPVFKSKAVRAALSMCIDRERLIQSIANAAVPVTGPIPRGYSEYCDTCNFPYYSYDPERAATLLSNAGWNKSGRNWVDKEGKVLAVTLLGYGDNTGSPVSGFINSIVDAWKAFGVQAEADIQQRSIYDAKLKNRDFDAAFHTLEYVFTPWLNRHFLKNGSENFSGYNNPVFESALNELDLASVPDKGPLWHKLHRIIGDDVPCAFLWTPKSYAAWSNWIQVRNWFDPSNFLRWVCKWEVE
jgi:peptide/nickel transport system substrate-binding protein